MRGFSKPTFTASLLFLLDVMKNFYLPFDYCSINELILKIISVWVCKLPKQSHRYLLFIHYYLLPPPGVIRYYMPAPPGVHIQLLAPTTCCSYANTCTRHLLLMHYYLHPPPAVPTLLPAPTTWCSYTTTCPHHLLFIHYYLPPPPAVHTLLPAPTDCIH